MASNNRFSNNNIISLSLLVLGLGIAIISITTPKIIGTNAAKLSCQGPNSCYQIGSTTTTASGNAVTVGNNCATIGLGTAPNKFCGDGYLCCGISRDKGNPTK